MREPRDSWQQCGILNEVTKTMTTAKDKIMTIVVTIKAKKRICMQ